MLLPLLLEGASGLSAAQDAEASAGAPASAALPHTAFTSAGPWGLLDITEIVISPPAEYLSRDWGPVQPLKWVFPGAAASDVRAILTASGLSEQNVRTLLATARPDPHSSGVQVSPTAELVRSLSPATRAALYLQLGRSERNPAQNAAYRYAGTTPDEWLGNVAISPRTRGLIDPLIYPHGQFLYFADMDLLRPQIADADELQRLVKRLLRQVTIIARLRIAEPARLGEIAEYWGRGGRRTDIRPLLESIAEAGGDASIDITHLLPTLARQYLYRYPRTTSADLAKPELANCFWTALNFFGEVPDDRFLDLAVSVETLKRGYYFVQDGFQLGDVVTFSDKDGTLFHVGVYIAGNLIFGKNGRSVLAPWSILPLDHIKGHYAEEFTDGARISYLRRKDM